MTSTCIPIHILTTTHVHGHTKHKSHILHTWSYTHTPTTLTHIHTHISLHMYSHMLAHSVSLTNTHTHHAAPPTRSQTCMRLVLSQVGRIDETLDWVEIVVGDLFPSNLSSCLTSAPENLLCRQSPLYAFSELNKDHFSFLVL